MNSQERVDVVAIITRLAELCPKAIFVYEGRRMPLKIGIYGDLAARVTGSITPDELKLALRSYTRNTGYLQAMARGGPRIDLEGNPVGEVTNEQMASAAKAVAAHWARQAARKAAARMACSSSETPAPMPTRPACETPAPVPAGPKRLGLADLRQLALARKATAQ
jgi:ProP effector